MPFGLVHRLSALAFNKFRFCNVGRWNTTSRNHLATRRLLFYLADSIFSFRAWHTGTLGETIAIRKTQVQQFKKDVSTSATQDSIMNTHEKTQLIRARINCALKDSSCDSPLPKNLKLTILASNASSSSTKVFKYPYTKNDSIFTQWFNNLKFRNQDQYSHSQR
ncbi:hypothetical protein H5410_051270 [Solanum commersonii]|uniref:Uncharacterized protein n=1 Tax=Solanum commersonii TaxID=4109 RepID=A0A9J5WXX3_SOLCO|nr:hypothetical protein H5410_051270 [Solanum commersonii]